MKRIHYKYLPIAVLVILLTNLVISNNLIQISAVSEPDYWPTAGWLIKTPAEVNITSAGLEQMDTYIADTPLLMESVLIFRYGYLIG